ncbi:MAG: hypothetical protein ABIE07_07465 [Candidatus Zixiibacteriota bacterium]
MLRKIILWSIAIAMTIVAALYQKYTGPTYPIEDSTTLNDTKIHYVLNRSHGGDDDQRIAIAAADTSISGQLLYKRYNTEDDFIILNMTREGDSMSASLPHQPPAGKLEYYIHLVSGENSVNIPDERTVVTRFKGAVPDIVLAPHIILIFLAMLWSTRTGLEALMPNGKTSSLTIQTVILLLLGGMTLGPIVQKFAFGEFWTGVPYGWDLTDNKTLVAFVGWLVALWRHRYSQFPRFWILAAAIILVAVFTIPHSMMGSELDYSTGEVETG